MKILFLFAGLLFAASVFGQDQTLSPETDRQVRSLIDAYSEARTQKDSALLRSILSPDIDQLVSTGVWRKGRESALPGMLQSSENNPGSRSITVEQIRQLTPDVALADARYTIENDDGTARKMWSTFVVVQTDNGWKIAAIRNMLPAERSR